MEASDDGFQWKYFSRQVLVSAAVWNTYFLGGLGSGTPAVAVPQLRRHQPVSDDTVSWLASIYGLAGVPWVFVLPILVDLVGRKIPFLIVCVTTLVGFIMFVCGHSAGELLASEAVLGVLLTAIYTVSPLVIAEYTAPRHRGLFLTVKSASYFWGIWVSNAIGTFYPWEYIGALGVACALCNASVLIWPESPYWLAARGRFEQCARAHRWLRGTGAVAERELDDLIQTQKKRLAHDDTGGGNLIARYVSDFKRNIRDPTFYKPLLLSLVLLSLYHFSGKLMYSMYILDILKQVTGSEREAYRGMLVMDGATVLGMYAGCALTTRLRRRTQLLGGAAMGAALLVTTGVYLQVWRAAVDGRVTLVLLTLFSLAASGGPVLLCSSLVSEVLSLRARGSATMVGALYTDLLYFSLLKLSPRVLRHSLPAACLMYALPAALLTALLARWLPETSGRTLQEIERRFHAPTPRHQTEQSKELIP